MAMAMAMAMSNATSPDLQMLNCTRRECMKIGVLYVRKGQSDETDWYGNEGGTLDYQEFLSSLGWGINVATHNGFIGMGLDCACANGCVVWVLTVCESRYSWIGS
jgi:hypothetical protein